MELNVKNIKKILFIVAVSIVLFIVLQRIDAVLALIGGLFGLITPLLIGLGIAFVMNTLLNFWEKRVFKRWENDAGLLGKIKRPVCLLLTILAIALIAFFVLFAVIPELINTLRMLSDRLPGFLEDMRIWLLGMIEYYNVDFSSLSALNVNWSEVGSFLFDFFQNGAPNIVSGTVTAATAVVVGIVNFFLGFVFALYILSQKEKLARGICRTMYAYLPESFASSTLSVARLANRIFSGFIGGQFLEAVILGSLCFIGMSIFGFPYAPMISVLVGCLALIPIFGAFIAVAIGAYLILLVNPMQALWFLVFFLILQQIEGNLIYPRVVGNSVGLPTLWVLFAVLVGGGLFGILGILLGVPTCSVIYTLLKQSVTTRLKEKCLDKRI
ncbi:MAG: AI-2E family transporter [Clostridia bacterium]|nr:AI-2E family transporter [Clostridia bacterium]